ncbi:MAG: type IV pilus twitching motility protein PilT [Planctomycetota bacterium]|jgi:twitching motility protein PilT
MAAIDTYLKFAIQAGASDFHLATGARPTFRVFGNMVSVPTESDEAFTPQVAAELVREIMPQENRDQFDQQWDTDFAYEVEELGRFRVNAFHDLHGVGAVFRHIPGTPPSFDELGLPPMLKDLCMLNKGLVLVTGPTGSGKSTTLAAMVDLINRKRKDHLITIEDPIEFVHKSKGCLVNQREVNRHTRSFAKALRAALRQDPDIVMVGEMRDLETTETAITTAETGHLVLGTLHTSTASSSVERIIDQFPPDRQAQIRTMLSISLKGIVSQTLLRTKEGGGRVAAMEILVATHAVSNLIREGKTHQIPSSIQTGGKLGMRMLNDDLLRLVSEDKVTPQEAYRVCIDKPDMQNKLRIGGFR